MLSVIFNFDPSQSLRNKLLFHSPSIRQVQVGQIGDKKQLQKGVYQ